MSETGVITIAIGGSHYVEQAGNMARSCRLHNPGLELAIVTDSVDPSLRRLFDHVIPARPDYGTAFQQKLSANRYTPFGRTLYIDSDCLVCGGLAHLWRLMDDRYFAIHGKAISAGFWYTDIEALRKQLGVAGIPKFNSGLFGFRSGPEADALLSRAWHVVGAFKDYGIVATHGGQCGDEPALAIAMAEAGVEAIADDGTGQGGTIDGINPRLEIDVLRGKCRYVSPHRTIAPPVAHFLAQGWRRPEYRREALKVRLVHDRRWPRGLAGAVGTAMNAYEGGRAVARRIARGLRISAGGPASSAVGSGAS